MNLITHLLISWVEPMCSVLDFAPQLDVRQ
jgi:hypothetical protein